jgi:dimethylaniline monooxygenase (N-oxide forming)
VYLLLILPYFGLSSQGKILHSHDYKEPHGYENKRVVIVGMGNSSGDVAVELSKVTSQVCILRYM